MGFAFTSDETGRSQVTLSNEPDYVVPLQIAPPSLENAVKSGKWLIVSMSVWSIHDILAGHRAIELVKQQRGRIKLGLRPFDYPQENTTWVTGLGVEQDMDHVEMSATHVPGIQEVTIRQLSDVSPIWVTVVEGVIVSIQRGQLSDLEIKQLIAQLLSDIN